MNRILAEPELKLFTPGPTQIPVRVAQAAAIANYHHRTISFSHVLRDTLENMRPLFGTSGPILPVHATGRGALEGVYNNLFSSKDKVLAIANGSFGEMAIKTLRRNCIPCTPCFEGWETNVDLVVLEQLIADEHPTAITAVWNDTSNGIVNPIDGIGALARKYGILFVVDAVSALGCMPFEFDCWGVDAAVVASQKGLMSPAGISFVALNSRALTACSTNSSRDFYINLPDILKNLDAKCETPGSTPVSLVLSVNEALNMICEEGVERVYQRHRALSVGTKAALVALNFTLYPICCNYRSDSLTVARVPKDVNATDIVIQLQRSYGILIGKGLGQTSMNNIRIAHMGYCYVQDRNGNIGIFKPS